MRAGAVDSRLEALVGPVLYKTRGPFPQSRSGTVPESYTVIMQAIAPEAGGEAVAVDSNSPGRLFISYNPSNTTWRIYRGTGAVNSSRAHPSSGRLGIVVTATPEATRLTVPGASWEFSGIPDLSTIFYFGRDVGNTRPWPGMEAAWILPRPLTSAEAHHVALAVASGALQ